MGGSRGSLEEEVDSIGFIEFMGLCIIVVVSELGRVDGDRAAWIGLDLSGL
jgi:hypothetical protein